jgi:hypothetical protein
MPHVVELFYADHCPACPEARAMLRHFAQGRPDIVVIERNIDEAGELRRATTYQLIATPAFVIDGRAVLYGVPTPATLGAGLAGGTAAPA